MAPCPPPSAGLPGGGGGRTNRAPARLNSDRLRKTAPRQSRRCVPLGNLGEAWPWRKATNPPRKIESGALWATVTARISAHKKTNKRRMSERRHEGTRSGLAA
eukprot:2838110-Pyramimonas_sp.AAC.1